MANISQFSAPATNEYAGDEVSALVLDPGSFATRAGFAGEDVPKSIVPTHYISSSKGPSFGENAINTPTPEAEVKNPYNDDGIVEDWETAAKLWEWTITSRLTGTVRGSSSENTIGKNGEDMEVDRVEEEEKPMSGNPLLMSEPGWQTAKNREKCAEIAMEEWGVPAFYLAQSGVLAAFSAGKPTALVVDIGSTITSVTPVHDGMVLKKAITKSRLAGNFISDQARILFQQTSVPLTPHYMVKTKTPVDAGVPSSATYHNFPKPMSASFQQYQEERVLTSFKESVVQVWEGAGHNRLNGANPQGIPNEQVAQNTPGRPFEMPDGWNQVFTADRFKIAEGIFDANAALTDAQHPAPKPQETLPSLISSCLSNLPDSELVPTLLQTIVVVGGSSLVYGLNRRLQIELEAKYPGLRVRIFSPGPVVERKFASWIGGSILGSLGSFHQLWVSKKEYEEHGASIVEKRCK